MGNGNKKDESVTCATRVTYYYDIIQVYTVVSTPIPVPCRTHVYIHECTLKLKKDDLFTMV
jgi:hypothetical protein